LASKTEQTVTKVTLILFLTQIVHLSWLGIFILPVVIGLEIIPFDNPILTLLFGAVDYIEIPALVTGIVFYLSVAWKKDKDFNRNMLMLILVVSQIFHILWITDEIIVETLYANNDVITFPIYMSLIAIGVDYLEIPVIIDLIKRLRNNENRNSGRDRKSVV